MLSGLGQLSSRKVCAAAGRIPGAVDTPEQPKRNLMSFFKKRPHM
jgi:hypothetical protein